MHDCMTLFKVGTWDPSHLGCIDVSLNLESKKGLSGSDIIHSEVKVLRLVDYS